MQQGWGEVWGWEGLGLVGNSDIVVLRCLSVRMDSLESGHVSGYV